MVFRILTVIQFYLPSGQVPHLGFHNLSPYCVSLVLPDAVSVTRKKFFNVQQINVAKDKIQLSMISELKCKDLANPYFERFF